MAENGNETPDYYRNTYARWYKWFAHAYDPFMRAFGFLFCGGFGGERRLRELIIEWIDPRPGEKILDICSGTGTLTIMLAERLAGTGKVVGIELSPAQLRVARRKHQPAGLSFIEGDARDVPFPDGCFDRSVVCGALHELPRDVRRRLLAEAHRVLKPEGKTVFVEHNKPDRKWKALLLDWMERLNPEYPTYKDLLECGLQNEIGHAGFKIVKRNTILWEFFQIVLAEKPAELHACRSS